MVKIKRLFWSTVNKCIFANTVKWWPKSFVFSISMITIKIVICYNYVNYCLILYNFQTYYLYNY